MPCRPPVALSHASGADPRCFTCAGKLYAHNPWHTLCQFLAARHLTSTWCVHADEFTTLTCIPGVIHYRDAKIQVCCSCVVSSKMHACFDDRTPTQLLDLPGIIEGASEGKGRGRQVIAVAKSADLILMVRTHSLVSVCRRLCMLACAGARRIQDGHAQGHPDARTGGGWHPLEPCTTTDLLPEEEDRRHQLLVHGAWRTSRSAVASC